MVENDKELYVQILRTYEDKMVDENERDTTLRIGILNEEMENKENLKLYQENFDIVITEDENLEEIIKKLIKI